MIKYFYAFVKDMVLNLDFEQWIYNKINEIEHFVSSELFLELYECDYSCPKALSHIKLRICQSFEKQFKNLNKENFYEEIDDELLKLIKHREDVNILKGTFVINCTEVNTATDLQKNFVVYVIFQIGMG